MRECLNASVTITQGRECVPAHGSRCGLQPSGRQCTCTRYHRYSRTGLGKRAQFPGTVFDALDDTRRQEQDAEQESTGCLRLERGAPLPADQEWYNVRFQRAKRGGRGKTTERPTNDEPTPEQQDEPDAHETDVVRITREAVRNALGHKGNVATPDVPLPSKVGTHSGGIVNASWIQPGASVKCAWRKRGEGDKVACRYNRQPK